MSADELTRAVNTVDLPALIAEHYPNSGARPGAKGDFKAVWRDEENASGSVYRNTSNTCWLFKDHGTDEGGNALQFLTIVRGFSDAEAAAEVKRRAGMPGTNGKRAKGVSGRIVSTYDYTDAQGELLFQAVRYEPKDFRKRQPKGKTWQWNLEGITPVLYRLPKVLEAVTAYRGDHPGDDPNVPARFDPAKAVYLVEGEKDVDKLELLGLTATCNPMGAGKWRDHYAEALQGAHVVLLPDNDDKGREHARTVAYSLERKAASIRIVCLPGLKDKGDVSDWLEAGGTLSALLELVNSAPHWYKASGDPLGAIVNATLGSAENTADEVEWTHDPVPLPPLMPEAPSLPPAMIPEPLRPWIVDAAERACVHLELIAVAAIVAASAVLGRGAAVYPKRHDDWYEPAHLWGALVAPPSSLKSMALNEGIAPLRRLAAQATKDYKEAQMEHAAEAEIIKLEIDALKKIARGKNGNPAGIKAELIEKMHTLEDVQPTERRYITNDGTIEKIGELLRDNPRGLLNVRDELMGLLKTCDKPGHEGDRAFLLEAWNGKGAFTFDRIGRGTMHIPALTLSILGGIQPGRLASYIAGALEGQSEADGLLQRFQLMVWPDKPMPWRRVDRYPDTEAKNRAYEIFVNLDKLALAAIAAENESA